MRVQREGGALPTELDVPIRTCELSGGRTGFSSQTDRPFEDGVTWPMQPSHPGRPRVVSRKQRRIGDHDH